MDSLSRNEMMLKNNICCLKLSFFLFFIWLWIYWCSYIDNFNNLFLFFFLFFKIFLIYSTWTICVSDWVFGGIRLGKVGGDIENWPRKKGKRNEYKSVYFLMSICFMTQNCKYNNCCVDAEKISSFIYDSLFYYKLIWGTGDC